MAPAGEPLPSGILDKRVPIDGRLGRVEPIINIGGMPWPQFQSQLGATGTPIVAAFIRLLGENGAVLGGGLAMAAAFFGFRAAQRWACLVLWLLPLHAAIDLCVVAIAGRLSSAVAVRDVGSVLALATSLVLARRQLLQAQSR